ncbi:MAG: serine/threonine-protein kinase [Verrucomicrobiales bacterium]
MALKRLLPLDGEQKKQREANKSAVNDLLREASILSAMQHPNIVAVFDAGVDEIWAYVVMELIEGEILRNAVERGPLVEEDFVLVAEQTLDALISAHHHGLLHRDIKPRNLMFRWLPSDSFQVKLLDFGLAKFSTEPSKQTEAFKDTIMGSSAYMAPEQFERKLLDPRADLYQLGCVYYYALTAMLPFDGEPSAAL